MDDTTHHSSHSPLVKLGGSVKYSEWEKSMYGRLLATGTTRIPLGTEVAPTPDTTAASLAAVNLFNQRSDRAAGGIYLWLNEGNKTHVDTIRDDPAAMWTKLKEIHSKSAPNAHFNSLSDLFNIRKKDDESLVDLATRAEGLMQRVKTLHLIASPTSTSTSMSPSPTAYTLETLDKELTIMAMIRTLPREEYSSFISSLLLLTNLTKAAVLEAFCTEETQRQGGIEDAATAAAARIITCYLCDGPHPIKDCLQYDAAHSLTKGKGGDNVRPGQGSSGRRRGGGGAGGGANSAKVDPGRVEEGCDGPAVKADAAVCQSSSSSSSSTDDCWNADSGASSSMTPHHKWFSSNYKPWRVPIYLADHSTIYSVGKGSVLFQPSGRRRNEEIMEPVVFTDVLHVPMLSNNLLSILTLTTCHDLVVVFKGRKAFFNDADRTLLFTATIDSTTTAYLDGTTICISQPECSALKATVVASGKGHLALAVFRCFSCPRPS